MFTEILVALAVLLTVTFHAAGIYFGIQAVLISRTPQAAVGWSLALVFCPYIAIPLFLIFGESRFSGYTLAGREGHAELDADSSRRSEPWRHFAPLFSISIPTRSDWESVCEGCRQPVETRAGS